MASNYQPTPVTLTNANDQATYSQIQTLIANAVLPGTSGTLRNSAADTTSGYLAQKLLVTSASGELAISTDNAAANEDSRLTFIRDEGQIALYDGIMSL